MKKYYFRWILAFLLSFVLLLPSKAFSITESDDYSIEDYSINMKVNEDNTFEITEEISAYFKTPKHGIYRRLPLRNSIIRTDGTKSNNRAKITNVSVDEKYEISKEDGLEVIKIGNPA